MQCRFIYLLCTFLILIPNVSCSGVITDCFFIRNITDSVELVCDALKGSYPKDDCFLRLFSLDAAFSNYRANVKHLKTGWCTSSNLRRRFFESFTNLRIIDLSFFDVEILSDLHLKYLQTFNASHNKLTTIKATNFRYMPEIREIDLAHNELSTVEYGTFSRLRELKILNLSFNFIEMIEHDPFKNNKKLELVHLENNPIKRIDSNIFLLLKKSVSVSVSWDNVREIDTSSLGTALRIEPNNNCEMFFRVSYRGFGLKCAGNVFQNLTYLNVSGNHLDNAPQIVELIGSSIEILDLASNYMGDACLNEMNGCSKRIFQRFTDLQVLNLSLTNLTSFSIEMFQHMKKLTILDLSFNQLQTLEFGSVVLNNLTTLKLEGNQLINGWVVNEINLPKLSFLSISDKHLSCDDSKELMRKWPNLHLINNSSKPKGAVDCENKKDMKIKYKYKIETTEVYGEQSTENNDYIVETDDGQQEGDETQENIAKSNNEGDKRKKIKKGRGEKITVDQRNRKEGGDERGETTERYGINARVEEIAQTEWIESTERIKTIDSIDIVEMNEATEMAETIEITELTEMSKFAVLTEKTNEAIKTTNEILETEDDNTTEITSTTENAESSTITTTQNMETTTDINFNLDDNEGDFTLAEVQSSFVLTETTTAASSKSATHSKLHNIGESTNKLAISSIVPRIDFSKSNIFAPKYTRKRKSLKMIPSAGTMIVLLVAFLVISIGYLILRLKCKRRFKRNLKSDSKRLHVPYKLDQLNDAQNNVELIDHLDFRQWQPNFNENVEQCQFD